MYKPKLFYSAVSTGAILGCIGGYAAQGDYVGIYSDGFIGAAGGFILWLLLAYLIDDAE